MVLMILKMKWINQIFEGSGKANRLSTLTRQYKLSPVVVEGGVGVAVTEEEETGEGEESDTPDPHAVKGEGTFNFPIATRLTLRHQVDTILQAQVVPRSRDSPALVVEVVVVVIEVVGGAVETERGAWEVGITAEDEEEEEGMVDSAIIQEK